MPLDSKIDCFNGGSDHMILRIDSANLYYFLHDSGCEVMDVSNARRIMNCGTFWLHNGFLKRKIYLQGSENTHFIRIKNFIKMNINEHNLIKMRKNLLHQDIKFRKNILKVWLKLDKKDIARLIEI